VFYLRINNDKIIGFNRKTLVLNNKFSFTSITKDDKKDFASSFAAYNKDGESTISLDSDSGEITIE